MTLYAITVHTGIRLAELGFALDAIGGAVLALGTNLPFGRRAGSFFGGAAIAVGSVLLVVATHWGHYG